MSVPVPERVIFDYALPAPLLQSYARLLARAWDGRRVRDLILDFERDLVPLLGVARSQAYDHLRLLRLARYIAWTRARGRYHISFPHHTSHTEDRNIPLGEAEASAETPAHTQFSTDLSTENPVFRKSGKPDVRKTGLIPPHTPLLGGVGGVGDLGIDSRRSIPDSPQHQHHQSEGGVGGESRQSGKPDDAVRERARALLERAQTWPDVAKELAGTIAEGDRPDLGDLLGWIAYGCDPDQGIRTLAAWLPGQLRGGLRAGDHYRPPSVCRRCRRIEGCCICRAPGVAPDVYLPPEFDDLAFLEPERLEYQRRWYCSVCFAFPCQCPE